MRLNWWWRRVQAAKDAGKRDGAAGIPATDGVSLSQWEERLVNDYEAGIRDLEEGFRKKDAPTKQQHIFAHGEHMRAKRAYEAKYEELKRPIVTRFSSVAGYIFLLFVLILELIFNQSLFVAIGDTEYAGYIVAFGISFAFLWMGHTIGMDIRHYGFLRSRWLVQLVKISLAIGILVGVAYGRTRILQDPGTLDDFEPLLGKWLGQNIDARIVSGIFMATNALVIVLAGWIAHESHDADPDYESLFQKYKKWARRAGRLAARRERLRAPFARKAAVLVENAQELINIYRIENLHARDNAVPPAIWRTETPDAMIRMEKYNFSVEPDEDETSAKAASPADGEANDKRG